MITLKCAYDFGRLIAPRSFIKLFALAAVLFQQAVVAAVVDYTATGSYYYEDLQVTRYDEDIEDYVNVNAFIYPQNPIAMGSTFTLNFSVDEDTAGNTPIFSSVRFFWDAVSNVSLSINGSNIFTTGVANQPLTQFPGADGYYSRWSWSAFADEDDSIALPGVMVFEDVYPYPPLLANLTAGYINFALYDPSDTVYSAGFPMDIITASLGAFSNRDFIVGWSTGFSEDDEGPYFDGDITYEVHFTIDSLVASPVPLPAAAWLFISALGGLMVAKRRQLQR